MSADSDDSIQRIKQYLREHAKSVTRFVDVQSAGADFAPIVTGALRRLTERYSKGQPCTNPEAVLYMALEQEVIRTEVPDYETEPVPAGFAERYGLRIADSDEEKCRWLRIRQAINDKVSPQLWPVAAIMLDDATERCKEAPRLKVRRVAQLLNKSYDEAKKLIWKVFRDFEG